eukprot:TRINITY_DN11127_c0_g1_i1.p1 TRINITY_DN11127_c0_g1~~TRINITY_DN11127_c0_g1_i1.p1  ORF type:complete len:226 (-),score=63.83 TRINITY_DN11127_c0_g1_i1:126-761(-)
MSDPFLVPISSKREKVPLKKGRTLLDWNRLTHTSEDLAGTGGYTIQVEKERRTMSDPFLVPISSKREKVPLKKGRTLLDWNRLTHTSEDLAGTGGYTIQVTREELRRHNKEDDCWMVLGGRVYNVTRYLEYHPGGIPKLMLCAGKDGTKLFNATHPWVNWESMMMKCYVGPFVTPPRSAGRAEEKAEEPELLGDLSAVTMFPAPEGPQRRE